MEGTSESKHEVVENVEERGGDIEKEEAPESKQEEGGGQKETEKEKEKEKEAGEASGDLKFESEWTFWFDKSPKKASATDQFEASLTKLGSFNDVAGFWRVYCYLKSPSEISKNSSIRVFRGQDPPTWEKYPQGGCWTIRLAKGDYLARIWEELLFAVIGERFEDLSVVGIVVNVRPKEDCVSVWIENSSTRFRIGERIKQILHLDTNTPIEFKAHSNSMKDRSTYRNSKTYVLP
eukprot:CAMPEP_0119128318 /NCGR_PEP_ID=MMETSP1310-20130426/6525_1 /TAXON_ID=464262 /ORGANISM="Genus nov. species nov., Strain RCC2339" /LENGTH=234 /DNA_ID=CAMNT_0007118649 /DNA_START=162 /DNA_END=866 /DNA_ORIENTATION=-